MKTLIIGHRGAAGLALENSSAAIQRALDLGVPMVEIDARLTKDKQLVVCHDADLSRVSDDKRKISDCTLKELSRVKLKDKSQLLTLHQALTQIGNMPVMVELKDSGSEYAMLEILDAFPEADISVASFKTGLVAVLRELHPHLRLYLLNRDDALGTVQTAHRYDFTGVALNFWTLGPHVYWLARRNKLAIYVYTVNSPFLMWFVSRLYPTVMVCTDYPNRFAGANTGDSS